MQGTGGGSYSLQKNREGIAPRQEKHHFITWAATITLDRICTFLKKIVAEAKSICVSKCNTKAMIFFFSLFFLFPQDGAVLMSLNLYISSEQQSQPPLFWKWKHPAAGHSLCICVSHLGYGASL